MNDIFWLAGASAAVWLGMGFYIAWLAAKQRQLARQLKNLELNDDQGDRPS